MSEVLINAMLIANGLKLVIEKTKDKLLDKGLDKIWEAFSEQKDTFENTLADIINKTIAQYALNKIDEGDKIPFYKSQVLMDQVLKFSFLKELDLEVIKRELETNKNITPVSEDELREFLGVFQKNVDSNSILKEVFIEENYKNEIYRISEDINRFFSSLEKEISDLNRKFDEKFDNNRLVTEWKAQLVEIVADYRSFKRESALSRMIKLHDRIVEENIADKSILARANFINALCQLKYSNQRVDKETGLLYIKAYTYAPNNIEYKCHAAVSYFELGEKVKGLRLAKEVLAEDEFNALAWLLICLENPDASLPVLKATVPAVVFTNADFQLNIANYLISNKNLDLLFDLIEDGFTIFENSIPGTINFKNLQYWSAWCGLSIQYYFSGTTELNPISVEGGPFVGDNAKRINVVIKEILKAVDSTDVENEDAILVLKFQHHFFNLLDDFNSADLLDLDSVYRRSQLLQHDFTFTFQLVRALANDMEQDNISRAFEIIEDYPFKKDYPLILLPRILMLMKLGKKDEVISDIARYFDLVEVIEEENVTNILQLVEFADNCEMGRGLELVEKLIVRKSLGSEVLKSVFDAYSLIITKKDLEGVLPILSNLEDKSIDPKHKIKMFIARCYMKVGLLENGVAYMKKFLAIDVVSNDFIFFAENAFKIPGERVYLQRVLKQLRENGHILPVKLIVFEIRMAILQYDFEGIKEICKYGLELYPKSAALGYNLLLSLYRLNETAEIEIYLKLIDSTHLSENEELAIQFFEILFQSGYIQDALDLMYDLARRDVHKKVREYYAIKMLTDPRIIFPQPEIVGVDTYVVYKIDSKEFTTAVTETNSTTSEIRQFLGKSKGDSFFSKKGYRNYRVDIINITDKYWGLLDEIKKDIDNPLSGMAIQSFRFGEKEENISPEKMLRSFVEELGPENELRTHQINETIRDFNLGKTAFSQLSRQVFNGNFIDCFNYLISKESHSFLIPPYCLYVNMNEGVLHRNIVLDLPAVLLLYRIERDLKISFSHRKFVIPNTINVALRLVFDKIKSQENVIGSLQVNSRTAVGIPYEKNHYIDRLSEFEEIDNWVKRNCHTLIVNERIDLFPSLDDVSLNNLEFQIVLDIFLLSVREEFISLTCDLTYLQLKSSLVETMVSPIVFLKQALNDSDFDRCMTYMSEHKFVGIPIGIDLLHDQFIKRSHNAPNSYMNCLRNLETGWNRDLNQVVAVSHIRWLLTHSLVSEDSRSRAVQEVFRFIIEGITQEYVMKLLLEIERQFALLPDKYELNAKMLLTLVAQQSKRG